MLFAHTVRQSASQSIHSSITRATVSTRPGAHSSVRRFQMPGRGGCTGACACMHMCTCTAPVVDGRSSVQISAPIRRPECPIFVNVICDVDYIYICGSWQVGCAGEVRDQLSGSLQHAALPSLQASPPDHPPYAHRMSPPPTTHHPPPLIDLLPTQPLPAELCCRAPAYCVQSDRPSQQ